MCVVGLRVFYWFCLDLLHIWILTTFLVPDDLQRDNSKKRLDNHHFESNATSGILFFLFSFFPQIICLFIYLLCYLFTILIGLHGQHNAKKPKLMKQSLDNTFDNINPVSGSIPSPVTSQVCNMPNTNRIIRLIGGRDRSRKAKAVKVLCPFLVPHINLNLWNLF